MIEKLLYLLTELKDNYSVENLENTLLCLRDEVVINDLNINDERVREALNGQAEEFYNHLASDLVEDLNQFPILYFIVWEPIIFYFNESTKIKFYSVSCQIGFNSDAEDFVKGFTELDSGNSEVALYRFNNIDNYVAYYFIACCYLVEENYENSIKQNELFLTAISENLKNTEKINLLADPAILTIQWNVFMDMGFAYSRIENFELALDSYDRALKIFDLEESYPILEKQKVGKHFDEFQIFCNNYIFALEKMRNYDQCLNLLDFLISKYGTNNRYQRYKEQIKENKRKNEKLNTVFNILLTRKRNAYNVASFEISRSLSKEKALEDMLLEQIRYGFEIFGKKLELYDDDLVHGRQYVLPSINRRLDLLLIDKSDGQLYVVELKRKQAGIEVIDQIENYINALCSQLNKKVKGIICVHQADSRLIETVKTRENIELFTYNFDFQKLT